MNLFRTASDHYTAGLRDFAYARRGCARVTTRTFALIIINTPRLQKTAVKYARVFIRFTWLTTAWTLKIIHARTGQGHECLWITRHFQRDFLSVITHRCIIVLTIIITVHGWHHLECRPMMLLRAFRYSYRILSSINPSCTCVCVTVANVLCRYVKRRFEVEVGKVQVSAHF